MADIGFTRSRSNGLGKGGGRSLRMMSVWAKHDPQERHWHLGPIGVHPALQGRGVGKVLVGSFLKTVDEQRRPAQS